MGGVFPYYSKLDFLLFSRYIGNDINIVPEAISHNIIEPILNPVEYRRFYEDKNMFDKVLPEGYLPKTLFRRIRGIYEDIYYNRIELSDGVIKSLCEKYENVIVKPTVGSSSGKGVQVYSSKKLTLTILENEYEGDFIVQEALTQHPYLAQFNSTSINTIRILVYKSPLTNLCTVINSAIRIGKKGSFLDNAHAGGLIVGIKDNGKLADYAVNQYGDKFKEVNELQLNSKEFIIPEYDCVKQFACDVASRIIHHHLFSLDIAICQSASGKIKPILIEYNLSSLGTWVWQYSNKPAFGDLTDEILEYCKNNIQKAVKVFSMRN